MVAAGYLLAPTVATYAKNFPKVNFAITDYDIHEPPFATKSGKVLPVSKNVAGITYAASRRVVSSASSRPRWRKKLGGKAIGAVGGIKIPPVDSYIAGYKYCANKAVPGTKTIVQYSNDFGAEDKCQAVAAE